MNDKLLETILAKIESLGTELRSDIKGLKNAVQDLKDDMVIVKNDIQHLKTEQSHIKQAVFETNDRINQLKDVQDRQQDIIELLSNRSIEQEASY